MAKVPSEHADGVQCRLVSPSILLKGLLGVPVPKTGNKDELKGRTKRTGYQPEPEDTATTSLFS